MCRVASGSTPGPRLLPIIVCVFPDEVWPYLTAQTQKAQTLKTAMLAASMGRNHDTQTELIALRDGRIREDGAVETVHRGLDDV